MWYWTSPIASPSALQMSLRCAPGCEAMNSRILRRVGSRPSTGSESGGAENGGLSLDHCRRKRGRSLATGPNPAWPRIRRLNLSWVPSSLLRPGLKPLCREESSPGRLRATTRARQHGEYPVTPEGKTFPEPSTVSVIEGRGLPAGPRMTLPAESNSEPWHGQ